MDIDKICDLVQEIGYAYRMELKVNCLSLLLISINIDKVQVNSTYLFKVKQYVLENISHSKSKDEVMFHAACWAHQQYVTSIINMKLEALLLETGHRKIV